MISPKRRKPCHPVVKAAFAAKVSFGCSPAVALALNNCSSVSLDIGVFFPVLPAHWEIGIWHPRPGVSGKRSRIRIDINPCQRVLIVRMLGICRLRLFAICFGSGRRPYRIPSLNYRLLLVAGYAFYLWRRHYPSNDQTAVLYVLLVVSASSAHKSLV